jgi:hypothetical protein
MAKKALVLFLVLALFGGGGWFAFRHYQHLQEARMEEARKPRFACDAQGPWTLIRLVDDQQNYPQPRWIHPLPGGHLVAQLNWPGQQWVALFKEGAHQGSWAVPCPQGVDSRAFESATLLDAHMGPDRLLILLYASTGKKQQPLTLAFDLATNGLRWHHVGPGRRLIAAGAQSAPGVYLAHADQSLTFLPFVSPGPALEGQTLRLPSDLAGLTDLLPVGHKSLIAAHLQGLSTQLEDGTWIHHEAPAPDRELHFPEGLSALARTAEGIWWQPRPGQLFKVSQDGRSMEPVESSRLLCSAPFSKDAPLLKLIGKDAQDRVWFGLALPTSKKEASKPTVDTQADEQAGWATEQTAAATPAPEDASITWEDYLKAPLDRVYVWEPLISKLTLIQLGAVWPKLTPPWDMKQPHSLPPGVPEAGGLLIAGNHRVAYLPLKALL